MINCLEEVQGADTSSLFPPPFFQDTWPCVQLLCAERNAHASETWPLTKPSLQCQIFNVKPQDTANIRSTELLARLDIEDLDYTSSAFVISGRLPWYGHVERPKGPVKTAFDIQMVGKRGPGRPKMTWKHLTEMDCREWKLSAISPHDRDTWRSGVRSAMRAASQLPGRWILPLYLKVNQKSDDDDDD